MKLYSFRQVDIFGNPFEFDLFIAVSGYEQRASAIAAKGIKAKDRIVLAFEDNKDHPIRLINNDFFKAHGFKFISIKGNEDDVVIGLIDNYIRKQNKSSVNILIDYSSMTRILYGGIIKYFTSSASLNTNLKLYFSYSIAEYIDPPEIETDTFNFYPISSYCNLSLPTKATALIAGLGYEKKRVFGLREYFDAEALYLFYTEESLYTDIVKQKNQEVINSVSQGQIFPYILTDLVYTKMLLQDLCETLSKKFRVVIAPCGPKPFTFLSFLVSLNYPNIDVWRISAGDDDDAVVNRIPTGEVITAELIFNTLSDDSNS